MNSTLYTKDNCRWCVAAKAALKKKNVPYEEVDVGVPENLEELKALYPEVKTVPQFFSGGERIGGFKEIEMWLADVYGGHAGDDV